MSSPIVDPLSDLAAAFDALGIRWYLFGAQAAILYGVARLTADIDVTILTPDIPTDRWLSDLETHGFERRFTDPAFIAQTRVVPVVHRATGLPVDLVLAGPGLEQEFMDRAVTLEVDGVAVQVIEISDLIILKVLAGRPKDVEDAAMLLRLHEREIDTDRVVTVLRMLEQALGQSDLIATLDGCLRRARD